MVWCFSGASLIVNYLERCCAMFHRMRILIVLLAAASLTGCGSWRQSARHETSLLKPVDLPSDGVQLEIVSIRFPYGDENLNSQLCVLHFFPSHLQSFVQLFLPCSSPPFNCLYASFQ